MENEAISVFISYSSADKSYKDRLKIALEPLERNGVLKAWDESDIIAGSVHSDELLDKISKTDLLLFLLSPDYLASQKAFSLEVKTAIERHQDPNDTVKIIPIITRFCDWAETDFKIFTALPNNGKPINSWPDPDEAYLQISNEIKKTINGPVENTLTESQHAYNQEVNTIGQFKELISEGQTKKALRHMMEYAKSKDEDFYNQLILLSGRFNSLDKKLRSGILNESDANVEQSRINYALLSVMDDFE